MWQAALTVLADDFVRRFWKTITSQLAYVPGKSCAREWIALSAPTEWIEHCYAAIRLQHPQDNNAGHCPSVTTLTSNSEVAMEQSQYK
eukprot:365113-Chlamydomonas_euryale.AAC.5